MQKKFQILMVGLSLVFLTACGSESTRVSTETKATITDSDLENKIRMRLSEDPDLRAADLKVKANVEKNEISLSGTVASEAVRSRAIEIARSSYLGTTVSSDIEVQPREYARAEYTGELARDHRTQAESYGDRVGQSVDDAWIHMKIVTKLIGNTQTPERKINVDVDSNIVTLRGTVDNTAQKAEAERVAKETDGVKRVVNQLKVSKGA